MFACRSATARYVLALQQCSCSSLNTTFAFSPCLFQYRLIPCRFAASFCTPQQEAQVVGEAGLRRLVAAGRRRPAGAWQPPGQHHQPPGAPHAGQRGRWRRVLGPRLHDHGCAICVFPACALLSHSRLWGEGCPNQKHTPHTPSSAYAHVFRSTQASTTTMPPRRPRRRPSPPEVAWCWPLCRRPRRWGRFLRPALAAGPAARRLAARARLRTGSSSSW